jgi:hypothetical protein
MNSLAPWRRRPPIRIKKKDAPETVWTDADRAGVEAPKRATGIEKPLPTVMCVERNLTEILYGSASSLLHLHLFWDTKQAGTLPQIGAGSLKAGNRESRK